MPSVKAFCLSTQDYTLFSDKSFLIIFFPFLCVDVLAHFQYDVDALAHVEGVTFPPFRVAVAFVLFAAVLYVRCDS